MLATIRLTYTYHSQKRHRGLGLLAPIKQRLDDVPGKGQGHDGGRTRADDNTLHPQPEESDERTERLVDVCVVGAGAQDGGAQLGVAVGADHGVEPAQQPDDDGHADAAAVLQHALGADEDPRPDDAADDDGDAVEQGQLGLQGHALVSLASRLDAVPVSFCTQQSAVHIFFSHFLRNAN